MQHVWRRLPFRAGKPDALYISRFLADNGAALTAQWTCDEIRCLMRGRVPHHPAATFPPSGQEQRAFDQLRFVGSPDPTFKISLPRGLRRPLVWRTTHCRRCHTAIKNISPQVATAQPDRLTVQLRVAKTTSQRFFSRGPRLDEQGSIRQRLLFLAGVAKRLLNLL